MVLKIDIHRYKGNYTSVKDCLTYLTYFMITTLLSFYNFFQGAAVSVCDHSLRRCNKKVQNSWIRKNTLITISCFPLRGFARVVFNM